MWLYIRVLLPRSHFYFFHVNYAPNVYCNISDARDYCRRPLRSGNHAHCYSISELLNTELKARNWRWAYGKQSTRFAVYQATANEFSQIDEQISSIHFLRSLNFTSDVTLSVWNYLFSDTIRSSNFGAPLGAAKSPYWSIKHTFGEEALSFRLLQILW